MNSDSGQSEDFQGVFREVKQWQVSGNGAFRETCRTICPLRWLPGCHSSVTPKATAGLEMGWRRCGGRGGMQDENWTRYNNTKQLLLLRFNCFLELFLGLLQFFGLCLEFWKSWLCHFFFPSVLMLFWWRMVFWRSFLAIPEVLLLSHKKYSLEFSLFFSCKYFLVSIMASFLTHNISKFPILWSVSSFFNNWFLTSLLKFVETLWIASYMSKCFKKSVCPWKDMCPIAIEYSVLFIAIRSNLLVVLSGSFPGSANLSAKRKIVNIRIIFCELYYLYHNYSTLSLSHESSHRTYIIKWACCIVFK